MGCWFPHASYHFPSFLFSKFSPKEWDVWSLTWLGTLWWFTLAIENYPIFIGKSSALSMGHGFHSYSSNNQRVYLVGYLVDTLHIIIIYIYIYLHIIYVYMYVYMSVYIYMICTYISYMGTYISFIYIYVYKCIIYIYMYINVYNIYIYIYTYIYVISYHIIHINSYICLYITGPFFSPATGRSTQRSSPSDWNLREVLRARQVGSLVEVAPEPSKLWG